MAYPFEYGEDLDDSVDEDVLFDDDGECMLGEDGQCGAAGSEYCEFECPNRDEKD